MPGVKETWQDLRDLGRLGQLLQLDRLFSIETEERCGRYAVPLLAIALFQVWSRLQVFYEWLEVSDDLPMRLDARVHYLRSEHRLERHGAGDSSRSSGDVRAGEDSPETSEAHGGSRSEKPDLGTKRSTPLGKPMSGSKR